MASSSAGFEDFVARASPRLVGVARLIIGDRQLAEDPAQETLIRVSIAWAKIKNKDAVDAYSYRTLVRLALRSRKRKERRHEIASDRPPELAIAEYEDSDAATRELVRAQLLLLPERQRATVVLRFYAQLTVEETARAMQCSSGTVKSQTAKALSTLRKQLSISLNR